MKLWELIRSDATRHLGYHWGGGAYFKAYILIPSVRFMFWFRIASYLSNCSRPISKTAGVLAFFILRHYQYLFGIDIARNTQIGKGFYIGHFGGIVISPMAIIGDNVNISQGVTIGVAGKGEQRGVPTIGSHVYIGAGAKLIGKIHIGDHVTIGANAVVTSSIPSGSSVVGGPAKVIGSSDTSYIILNPA